jgi:hypothetical protein
MATYIAMLRGINITGHKIIRMVDLRASFEALGFRQVKSYVQSGNVIFEASKDANLVGKMEKKILADYGFDVSILLKTPREMARVIRNNPLLKIKGIDDSRLYVTFLWPPRLRPRKAPCRGWRRDRNGSMSAAAKFISIARMAMAKPSCPTPRLRKNLE